MKSHDDRPDTNYILEHHIGFELYKIRVALENLTCVLHSMTENKPFSTYKDIDEEIGNE